jgi:hypothetical protein
MNKPYVAMIERGKYFQGWGSKRGAKGGINTAIKYDDSGLQSNIYAAYKQGWKFMEIKEDGSMVEVQYEEQ